MPMRKSLSSNVSQSGVMLLEALIAILIFSVGILAIVGMQAAAVQTVTDAKHRTEAGFLANELLSRLWTDAGNIGAYAYTGSGTPPARLSDWVTKVGTKLPGTTAVPPIVTVPSPTPQGATVTIQVFWQLPEEASKGLPPHKYTIVAAIYTS
jgi:type IV pilus assembly protein PilV